MRLMNENSVENKITIFYAIYWLFGYYYFVLDK